MSDGLLEEIIRTEKELQAESAAELARVRAWKARELAQFDTELDAARAAAEQVGRDRLAQARVAADAEAEALVHAAGDWCQRLQQLEDDRLRDVLGRQLRTLLPEGDHDHPDGQS